MRNFIFKLVGITLGTLIGLLLAEVLFRVYHYATSPSDLSVLEVENRAAIQQPETELKLGQIIQLSAHPRIIYELIPNSHYRFQGVAVQTNAQGFRDVDYPKAKVKRTRRVIGLGDSVLFGWGVNETDSYFTQLETRLNQQDSISYELINTGVPGYNTSMEVALLEEKFDLQEVDAVLLNFVGNDFDLPDFIRKQPAYFGIKKSFILQHLGDNKGKDNRLGDAPFDKENWRFQRKPEAVPEAYQDMVGEASFQRALQQLANLSKQHDFPVLVLSHSPFIDLPPLVSQTCEELGFEFINLKSDWINYTQTYPNAKWKLAENDWHPSVEGHTFIAKALEERIRKLLQNDEL